MKFVREIRDDLLLDSSPADAFILHRQGERWSTETGDALIPGLASSLEREAVGSSLFVSEKEVLVRIQEQFAMQIRFLAPLDEPARQRVQKRISRAIAAAKLGLSARYDSLTALYNRSGLEHELKSLQGVAPGLPSSRMEATGDAPEIYSLYILALDIDYFKQVNDTYGHIYGDAALKAVARTLNEVAQHASSKKLHSIAARLGGEEFVVVMVGLIQKGFPEELADRIRTQIAGQETPTRGDLERISAHVAAIPPPRDRRVTVSIGLAGVQLPAGSEHENNIVERLEPLRVKADAALYRAKAAGRNQVCSYVDILKRYGRVIEHHAETDVVAIDLGRQVGIEFGQEFLVFHPDFTGTTPFYQSDGRTRKQLGLYPRRACGRVVAFDVQDELTFCEVSEKSVARFPQGSSLEAIALGSITHLLSTGPHSTQAVSGAAELKTRIENLAGKNKNVGVAVFAIARVEELRRKRGIAFINAILAELVTISDQLLPVSSTIVQIAPTQLAVLVEDVSRLQPENTDPYNRLPSWHWFEATLSEALQKLTGGKEHILVGAFVGGLEPSGPSAKHALEFAQYATVELSERAQIELFTPDLADKIIQRSRALDPEVAIADYDTFTGIGVETVTLANECGLAALAANPPRYDRAIASFRRAVELSAKRNPEQPRPILLLNLAIAEFASGDKVTARESFQRALEIDPKLASKMPSAYLAPYALSLYDAYLNTPLAVDPRRVESALEKALSGKISAFTRVTKEDLQRALRDVAKAPRA